MERRGDSEEIVRKKKLELVARPREEGKKEVKRVKDGSGRKEKKVFVGKIRNWKDVGKIGEGGKN